MRLLYTAGIPESKRLFLRLQPGLSERASSPAGAYLPADSRYMSPANAWPLERYQLEDDEADRANLYPDLYFQTHLERYSRLDGCRRFASASAALCAASSRCEVIWAREQPRER
jgi:hypothetical protein